MTLPRFLEYAEAFERAYASGDWQTLEPYFTRDIVYEIHYAPVDTEAPPPARYTGLPAVLDYLERVTAAFDKRFASRRLVPFSAPREDHGSVWLHGAGVYTMGDGSRCHLVMEERAEFAGERIARLTDYITPGGMAEVRAIRRRYPQVFGDVPG